MVGDIIAGLCGGRKCWLKYFPSIIISTMIIFLNVLKTILTILWPFMVIKSRFSNAVKQNSLAHCGAGCQVSRKKDLEPRRPGDAFILASDGDVGRRGP